MWIFISLNCSRGLEAPKQTQFSDWTMATCRSATRLLACGAASLYDMRDVSKLRCDLETSGTNYPVTRRHILHGCGQDVASRHSTRCATFRNGAVISKRREPTTQWRDATSCTDDKSLKNLHSHDGFKGLGSLLQRTNFNYLPSWNYSDKVNNHTLNSS